MARKKREDYGRSFSRLLCASAVVATLALAPAAHADTTGGSYYDCTRAGNSNVGQSTTFVLGTHAVLTPLTTYYYEITDGSNLMPGSFATSALTSPGGTRFSGAVGLSGKVGTQ